MRIFEKFLLYIRERERSIHAWIYLAACRKGLVGIKSASMPISAWWKYSCDNCTRNRKKVKGLLPKESLEKEVRAKAQSRQGRKAVVCGIIVFLS